MYILKVKRTFFPHSASSRFLPFPFPLSLSTPPSPVVPSTFWRDFFKGGSHGGMCYHVFFCIFVPKIWTQIWGFSWVRFWGFVLILIWCNRMSSSLYYHFIVMVAVCFLRDVLASPPILSSSIFFSYPPHILP